MALKRALTDSLATKVELRKRAWRERVSERRKSANGQTGELKVEVDEEETDYNGFEDVKEVKDVDLTENDAVSLPDSFKRLSSPNFSEDDSSCSNFGRASCPRSVPSSPPLANRSLASLHLYVSSSSSPFSSCLTSSSECPSSPWSPRREKENQKKKKTTKRRRKKRSKASVGKMPLKDTSEGAVKKRRTVLVQEEGRRGVREGEVEGIEQDKTKVRDGRWRRSLSTEMDAQKESFYQPQRKFASNHTPPVRFVDVVVAVCCCCC